MLHALVTCPLRSRAWVHEGMAALPHGNGTFLECWGELCKRWPKERIEWGAMTCWTNWNDRNCALWRDAC